MVLHICLGAPKAQLVVAPIYYVPDDGAIAKSLIRETDGVSLQNI